MSSAPGRRLGSVGWSRDCCGPVMVGYLALLELVASEGEQQLVVPLPIMEDGVVTATPEFRHVGV